VEAKVLRVLRRGSSGVDGRALAAEHGLDPAGVEAALSRIRAEVPCRLRVTASGRLLHDFAPADLARLARGRVLGLPGRAALFALVALANAGAAWPLALSAVIGTLTLGEMCTASSDGDVVLYGLAGLLLIALALGLTFGLGLLADAVLMPLAPGPRAADLAGLSRLVGGCLLAGLACSLWVLDRGVEGLPTPWPMEVLPALAVGLAAGTSALAAVARYAARASACAGVLRDVRRAALAAVREAIDRGDAYGDAGAIARAAHASAARAWPDLPAAAARAEVEVALADLEVAPVKGALEGDSFDLRPLAARLAAITRAAADAPRAEAPAMGDDPVGVDSGG
jgi:hypothetical protein